MWVNQLRWADRSCTAISLLALLLAAPTIKAQAVNPMEALQFYVGRWSCLERKAGDPPLSSTFTFAIESNLMRQWIARPKQGSMQASYVVNSTFAYDATRHRYVQTEMDNDATCTFLSPNPGKATPFVGSTWRHLQSFPAGR